jgi:hypothetical protein
VDQTQGNESVAPTAGLPMGRPAEGAPGDVWGLLAGLHLKKNVFFLKKQCFFIHKTKKKQQQGGGKFSTEHTFSRQKRHV